MTDFTYRYFRSPHDYSYYSHEAKICGICSRVRFGYNGPFYGEDKIDYICEECLFLGKLAERGLYTNEGNTETLRTQLTLLHPDWPPDQVERLVQERTTEIETRTPLIITWQDLVWPVQCGDYCCYIKEVGADDFTSLDPNEDGFQFLWKYLELSERSSLREDGVKKMWDRMKRNRAGSNRQEWTSSEGIYLFQCMQCGDYLILSDFD